MSPYRTESAQLPCIPAELVRSQLARIREHPLFVRSARIRRFLEFTVNSHLAGHAQELKEYVIGLEVFDRPADHDPRLDPIVRVEARRLRAKLRAFYESDGAQDPILIEYPRGTYVPQVRWLPPTRPLETPMLIAVVPFASARQEHCTRFAEGLTREVMDELDHCGAVRVFNADGIRRVRARIEAVLTGTVDCGGPRRRVTAELLSTGNAQNLWSAEFESAGRDPRMAQKQIAFATVQALSRHFRPAAPSGVAAQPVF